MTSAEEPLSEKAPHEANPESPLNAAQDCGGVPRPGEACLPPGSWQYSEGEMASLSEVPENGSDRFRLHYVQGTQRCVVAYDTLEAALEGACRKLQADQGLEVWISDESKRVLLDARQIWAHLARGDPRNWTVI
jgi:hypothetical protein